LQRKRLKERLNSLRVKNYASNKPSKRQPNLIFIAIILLNMKQN